MRGDANRPRGMASWAGLVLGAVLAGGACAEEAVLRAPEPGTVRALVIGVDAYRTLRPLKGATADARDLVAALRRMGVTDITALMDEEADRAAILRAIAALQQRTLAGDLVILTLAGHGAQEPERVKGSQPDGMDNVFVLAGFDPGSRSGSSERIIGTEFNRVIKEFEAKGARVLFVADTCHGGGLVREVDPRGGELSFRQAPRYRLAVDDLKPISTAADAFLTELDFSRTAFLAAVDRKTKAPEVRIPGVPGYRGALSYAVARAFEGNADSNRDGAVTLNELFSNIRQVVYQLSDQRQNVVTYNSPDRDLDRDVVFRVTRGVRIIDEGAPAAAAERKPGTQLKIIDAAGSPSQPPPAQLTVTDVAQPVRPAPTLAPVRIAAADDQRARFAELAPRTAQFEVVSLSAGPDLVWDPRSRDVIAGGDVIAYGVDLSDLPSVIDRVAAVQGFKQLATHAPQTVRTAPNDRVHRSKARVEIEVAEVADRALVMFNLAGDGTVQALYPIGSDPVVVSQPKYRFPVEVRPPFGADQIVVVTSRQRMTELEQALNRLSQRRSALEMLRMVERYSPPDARIGTTGLFTAP